jgi:hypothetical protein
VRPSIGQTLAFDANRQGLGAHLVIDAKAGAVVVAEFELREIAMQVLFSAVLIHALHAALKYREIAFNRVGMNPTVAFG